MATRKAGQVTLRGRFRPGARVRLIKVAGPEVLRPAPNDEVIEEKRVGEDGVVQFSKGVDVGSCYFVSGHIDGTPTDVRIRGRSKADEEALTVQDPVQPDAVRFRGGGLVPDRGTPAGPRLEHDGTAEAPLPAETLEPSKLSAEEAKEKATRSVGDESVGDDSERARRSRAARKAARTRRRQARAEVSGSPSEPKDHRASDAAAAQAAGGSAGSSGSGDTSASGGKASSGKSSKK